MTSAPPPPPVASDGAGSELEQGRPRIFPCEECGADFEFAIEAQSLQCPYCGHVKALELDADASVEEQDLRAAIDALAEKRSGGENTMAGISQVGCRDCGAKVRFQGTLTSQECPYCGTPIQLSGVHDAEDRIRVDGVLPFKVKKEAARTGLKAWVGSRWFAPNEFKQRGVQGRFAGVYMPYWTYDALTMNDYRGERGEHYTVTVKRGEQEVRETRTRWYPASGSFRRFFDDLLVVAGRGLPTKVLRSLEPWPLHECLPFNQQVLAGYMARTYDLALGDGFKEAERRIASAIKSDVRQRIGGDEQRVHKIRTEYGAMTYKHLLLPVWILAYKYGDKTFQVVVNAATGEVQGERPYSWIKITLFVVMILAVAGGVYYFARS
jgi:DNA-directed RNA polymerase subunit RPC12/RpoP